MNSTLIKVFKYLYEMNLRIKSTSQVNYTYIHMHVYTAWCGLTNYQVWH